MISLSMCKRRWLRNRAILRCHWSLLQSEITKSMDCLKNLKPLRHRLMKWRKSLPILSQGGLLERIIESTGRVRPFERSDKSRHCYLDLPSLNQLDFKFPGLFLPLHVYNFLGSGKPKRVLHPHCNQTFSTDCIYCCPAFNKEFRNDPPVPISDVAERSVAIDKPECE